MLISSSLAIVVHVFVLVLVVSMCMLQLEAGRMSSLSDSYLSLVDDMTWTPPLPPASFNRRLSSSSSNATAPSKGRLARGWTLGQIVQWMILGRRESVSTVTKESWRRTHTSTGTLLRYRDRPLPKKVIIKQDSFLFRRQWSAGDDANEDEFPDVFDTPLPKSYTLPAFSEVQPQFEFVRSKTLRKEEPNTADKRLKNFSISSESMNTNSLSSPSESLKELANEGARMEEMRSLCSSISSLSRKISTVSQTSAIIEVRTIGNSTATVDICSNPAPVEGNVELRQPGTRRSMDVTNASYIQTDSNFSLDALSGVGSKEEITPKLPDKFKKPKKLEKRNTFMSFFGLKKHKNPDSKDKTKSLFRSKTSVNAAASLTSIASN